MSSSQYINDSRGANARLALIEAGMDLFGEYGFKGATTRMIADQAEVNISAIAYYFGGKEELYYAVAEFILSEMVRHFNEFGSDWKKIIEEDISKKDVFELTVFFNRIKSFSKTHNDYSSINQTISFYWLKSLINYRHIDLRSFRLFVKNIKLISLKIFFNPFYIKKILYRI